MSVAASQRMRLASTFVTRALLAALLASATACGSEDISECVDICDELDACFDSVETTECIDRCEEQADDTIEACNGCLDASDMECTDCADFCSVFLQGGTAASPP